MKSIELHTPKGLARELGISYRAILDAIKTGELECIKFSARRWKIRSKAAADWTQKKARGHLSTPNDT